MVLLRILFLSFGFSLNPKIHANENLIPYVPNIEVVKGSWGEVTIPEVKKVLNLTAKQLFPSTQKREWDSILVKQSNAGPMVLFERGQKGEYTVYLDTHGRYWCQYVFQFAHEIGHIICGYHKENQKHLWFEETICEVASLFALHSMSKEWKDSLPYPNLENYAEEFKSYAANRMKKNSFANPDKFQEWIRSNKDSLVEKPMDRSMHGKMATILLPYFKNDSFSWSACLYLNKTNNFASDSFDQYLNRWKKNCPFTGQKEFVQKISKVFGILLPE